ncbi:hypothetical protein DSECCO2_605850 [anaerobic digester metagenome]
MNISVEMISFMPKRRRSTAGTAAHNPPAMAAHRNITGIMAHMGRPGKASTAHVAPTAPRANCPSAPMFHTCMRNDTATPSEHKKMGMDFSSVSSSAKGPPKPPDHRTASAFSGGLPCTASNAQLTPSDTTRATAKMKKEPH